MWARLVREVARLEGGVEAELGDGDGGIWVVWVWDGVGSRYHVFAFEAAAVDARRECAGSVPG